jgi:hypothetical protein
MPRHGCWWLSEYRGRRIGVACTKCGVSADYDAYYLWRQYGEVRMTDLRHDLAADLECERGPHADYRDKCALHYTRGPE